MSDTHSPVINSIRNKHRSLINQSVNQSVKFQGQTFLFNSIFFQIYKVASSFFQVLVHVMAHNTVVRSVFGLVTLLSGQSGCACPFVSWLSGWSLVPHRKQSAAGGVTHPRRASTHTRHTLNFP